MISISHYRELTYENARDTAVRFLSYKGRSENEICERLVRDGYPEEIIGEVLVLLRKHNFINDEQYTESYIDERMNRRKFGGRRIAYELSMKGIDQSLITEKLSQQDGELDAAIEAAEKRLRNRTAIDYSEKKKIMGYLMRRGFSYGTIREAFAKIAETSGLSVTNSDDEYWENPDD